MAVYSSNTDHLVADNHSYRKSLPRKKLVQALSEAISSLFSKITLHTYIERIESQG